MKAYNQKLIAILSIQLVLIVGACSESIASEPSENSFALSDGETAASSYWLYHVNSFDFVVNSLGSTWYQFYNYIYRSNSTQSQTMFATIHLPDGSHLWNVKCDVFDNDASNDLKIEIYEKTRSSSTVCKTIYSEDFPSIVTYQFELDEDCWYDTVVNEAGTNHQTFMIKIQTAATTSAVRLYQCSFEAPPT